MKAFGLEIGGREQELVIGGQPAVDLLPPEVVATRESRRTRRGIVTAAVALVIVAVAAGVGAKLYSVGQQLALGAAQNENVALVARESDFAELIALQSEIAERTAARHVVTGVEVDWSATIGEIQAALPEGTTLTEFSVAASSPMAVATQPTAPLQGPRVAEITFRTMSPTVLSVPEATDALGALTGFVDVQVPSSDIAEGGYETVFVVHIDEQAYANRFGTHDAEGDEG